MAARRDLANATATVRSVRRWAADVHCSLAALPVRDPATQLWPLCRPSAAAWRTPSTATSPGRHARRWQAADAPAPLPSPRSRWLQFWLQFTCVLGVPGRYIIPAQDVPEPSRTVEPRPLNPRVRGPSPRRRTRPLLPLTWAFSSCRRLRWSRAWNHVFLLDVRSDAVILVTPHDLGGIWSPPGCRAATPSRWATRRSTRRC